LVLVHFFLESPKDRNHSGKTREETTRKSFACSRIPRDRSRCIAKSRQSKAHKPQLRQAKKSIVSRLTGEIMLAMWYVVVTRQPSAPSCEG